MSNGVSSSRLAQLEQKYIDVDEKLDRILQHAVNSRWTLAAMALTHILAFYAGAKLF